MSNYIEVDYSRLKMLSAALRQAPAIAREELLAAVTEADALLATQAEAYAPIGATGAYAGGIHHMERVSESGVIGMVSSPMNYAEPVELGTRPHFPPIEPLIDWVIQKLGVPEKEARGVAFLVARKISKKGTDAQLVFTRALVQQAAALDAIFTAACGRISARIGAGA